MRIRNIDGTSDTACTCGSWLDHWKSFSGCTVPLSCPVDRCGRVDLVGAHVQKADGMDGRWYIYPLCSAHNWSVGILDVPDYYPFVPANKSETCGKWRPAF